MKIKIVEFENGKYGVQMKTWFDENAHWLDSDGWVRITWRPSVERWFDTIQAAEQAIERYKESRTTYKDRGKFVKEIKL